MITLISRELNQDDLLEKACGILRENGIESTFVKYEDSRASTWWSKDDIEDEGSTDLPDKVKLELLERKAQVIKNAMISAGNEAITEILDEELGLQRWDD